MSVDTIFAFDFGVKRIGVAMGNTMIRQAQPVKVISAIDNATRFADIGALLDEWKPARLVVGLPMHPDGAEHDMTARARRFANQLHDRFNLPVELVDERYSSAVLTQKRGVYVDDEAASVLLQQYFDESGASGPDAHT